MADRLRTAPLFMKHLVFINEKDRDYHDHPEQGYVPKPVQTLYHKGYPVDIVARHVCMNDKPDSDSNSYLLVELETTTVPFEDADVVDDSLTMLVCSCWDYVARRSPFAKEHEGPTDATECKHCERVLHRHKRQRADGQASLGGVVQ